MKKPRDFSRKFSTKMFFISNYFSRRKTGSQSNHLIVLSKPNFMQKKNRKSCFSFSLFVEPLHPPCAHMRTSEATKVTQFGAKRVAAMDQGTRAYAQAHAFKMPPKHSCLRFCPQSNGIERSLFKRALNAPQRRARLRDSEPTTDAHST